MSIYQKFIQMTSHGDFYSRNNLSFHFFPLFIDMVTIISVQYICWIQFYDIQHRLWERSFYSRIKQYYCSKIFFSSLGDHY